MEEGELQAVRCTFAFDPYFKGSSTTLVLTPLLVKRERATKGLEIPFFRILIGPKRTKIYNLRFRVIIGHDIG